MLNWRRFVRLSDTELARLDIAVINLSCAEGLPGSQHIDVEYCLAKLNEWAESCRRFTNRVMPMFHRGRCDYPESEPKFRIQAMITHLQRDLGVIYHPDRIAEDAVFQPQDSFLHGVIQGVGGTCASMPVVYAAVGRRLGYPIMLGATRSHLYCRWDALPHGECFNIEGAGEGISFFPDDHFRSGKYQMPAETVKMCGYLKSQSPREEFAGFLCQRGFCWTQEENYLEGATSYAWATELAPDHWHYGYLVWQTLKRWKETLQARLPSRLFPKLDLGLPERLFQNVPKDYEREMIGLRVLQGLLDDPDYERRWWGPLRRNPDARPQGLPASIPVNFRWNVPS